jgi:RNA polymerase-binding transcription factor DksA
VELEPGRPEVVTPTGIIGTWSHTVSIRLDELSPGPGEAEATSGDSADELDIDESVLDAIEEELADVERALARLDDGTYAQCEACRKLIDDAVLARSPAARFCAEHLPLALP